MSATTAGGATPPDTPPAMAPRRGTAVRSRVNPDSRQALAMLTVMPVLAAPVPRLHVQPRQPDGRTVVQDRTSGDRFEVYTPRFVAQFRDGHRGGQWYVRPVSEVATAAFSLGFPTARAAIEAVNEGRWRLSTSPRPRVAARVRVIWSVPVPVSASAPETGCAAPGRDSGRAAS